MTKATRNSEAARYAKEISDMWRTAQHGGIEKAFCVTPDMVDVYKREMQKHGWGCIGTTRAPTGAVLLHFASNRAVPQ